jgi:nitrogen fixation/metabolism regulation signal transduction histidine kinase
MLQEIEVEMMEKINYMSQTIDDFSNFFSLSKKKEPFDLLKNINDSIRLLDVQLKLNNINIQINTEEKNNITILGLTNEFRQVIMNMVHNAMFAIVNKKKKDGLIIIDISSKKEETTIKISDNGGGIKKSNIDKIFDPYFTTRDKGSGIGLYMSKVIIENHMNGYLEVQNYKEGAMFCITLKNKKVE